MDPATRPLTICHMRNSLVVLAVVALALLTGCAHRDHTRGRSQVGSGPSSAPLVVAPGAEVAASPDARLTVTGVRLEHLAGTDRVTYELGGTGRPGWQVHYVDKAVRDGAGTVVDMPGASILEVRILGSAYPWDSGVAGYEGPNPLSDPAVPNITGVYGTEVFEGRTQSFIGIDSDRPPFSVSAPEGSPRIVVDFTTP